MKPPRAVTLIELMISITVIGILTSIVFSSLRSSRQHTWYKESLNNTVDLLQTARMKALASMELPAGAGTCEVSRFYIQFDSIPEAQSMDLKAEFVSSCSTPVATISTTTLNPTTSIDNQNIKQIFFATPDAALSFTDPLLTKLTLTVQSQNGAFEQDINLTKATGLVELAN